MGLVKRQWEEYTARGFGYIAGSMCATHIRDAYLRENLLADTVSEVCFVCGRDSSDQVEADALLGRMAEVATLGMAPPENPYSQNVDTIDLFWELFEDLFDIDDPVAIFEHLLSADQTHEWAVPYIDSLWNEDDETESPSASWLIFKELVQYQSRFIFLTSDATSGAPENAVTAAGFVEYFLQILAKHESSIVRELPADLVLYRGRMLSRSDAGSGFTAAEMGPPPAERVAPSRMSPVGIPMLYAAESLSTAVAEIAGHDPAQREYALVAGLRLLRPLRVVDLADVEIPSLFDLSRSEERSHKQFLKSFARDISRPIRLDGREHREYAPTQVLTEVVRWSLNPAVDGIRYRSARDDAPTLVLFFGSGAVIDDGEEETANAAFILCRAEMQTFRVQRQISLAPLSKTVLFDNDH